MENKPHTSGPWHVKWDRNSVYIRSSLPDRDLSICRVMNQRNANNLPVLLYAPDLLETCERLLGFAKFYADPTALTAGEYMLEQAQTLINKARGVHIP